MRITKGGLFSGLVSNAATSGGVGGVSIGSTPSQQGGQAPVSSGSNTATWQSVIQGVTSNGSNSLLGPYVNLASGTNINFAVASNTLTINGSAGGGGGSAITVLNEGSSLTTALASLDFVGTGVTATTIGNAVTVTIPSTGIQLASITAASSAIAATEAVVVSASLPANSIVAGNSYRITGAGVGTTGVTPGTDTFRIRIGTTTLTGTIPTSTTALGVAAVTGQSFSFVAIITVRTGGGSGTVIGECIAFSANVATGRYATLNNLSATTATVALDTTAVNLLELTFQSGNAGSSNTFHVASIEQLTVGAASAASSGGLVLLEQHSASASATLDFTTFISSTYDDYQFELLNIVMSTTNVLQLRCSVAAAFDSGANYHTSHWAWSDLGSTVGGGTGGTSCTVYPLAGRTFNTTANKSVSGFIKIFNPAGSGHKDLLGSMTGTDSVASTPQRLDLTLGYLSTSVVDGIRFLASSGTITSGTIRVYGIAK